MGINTYSESVYDDSLCYNGSYRSRDSVFDSLKKNLYSSPDSKLILLDPEVLQRVKASQQNLCLIKYINILKKKITN